MTEATTDWRPLVAAIVAIAAAVIGGWIYGPGVFFLTLAGSVLLWATWIFWRSLQGLTGDAPLSLEEALGLTAPSAEEERKLAVLRALKDLEYERSVGKITEDDYRELSHKYRTEAKRLLQLLDEQLEPARQRAEQLVERHLSQLEQGANQRSAAKAKSDDASKAKSDDASKAKPDNADKVNKSDDASEAKSDDASTVVSRDEPAGEASAEHGAPNASAGESTTPRSAIQTRGAALSRESEPVAPDASSEPTASAPPAPKQNP